MNITENKKDKGFVSIALEGDMIINSVKDLKGQLLKYFKSLKNMEVDLSSVKKIDSAGFQLLAMLKKELEGKEKTFAIVNPSAEIRRIYELYGETL
jgi:anti-sigma B factor antagonist